MTDPVEALRAIAEGFDAKGWVNNAQHCRDAADEVDRLRTVIENAPHAYLECTARGLACSCWKADAL